MSESPSPPSSPTRKKLGHLLQQSYAGHPNLKPEVSSPGTKSKGSRTLRSMRSVTFAGSEPPSAKIKQPPAENLKSLLAVNIPVIITDKDLINRRRTIEFFLRKQDRFELSLAQQKRRNQLVGFGKGNFSKRQLINAIDKQMFKTKKSTGSVHCHELWSDTQYVAVLKKSRLGESVQKLKKASFQGLETKINKFSGYFIQHFQPKVNDFLDPVTKLVIEEEGKDLIKEDFPPVKPTKPFQNQSLSHRPMSIDTHINRSGINTPSGISTVIEEGQSSAGHSPKMVGRPLKKSKFVLFPAQPKVDSTLEKISSDPAHSRMPSLTQMTTDLSWKPSKKSTLATIPKSPKAQQIQSCRESFEQLRSECMEVKESLLGFRKSIADKFVDSLKGKIRSQQSEEKRLESLGKTLRGYVADRRAWNGGLV